MKIFAFVIALALFLGGMYLMGHAIEPGGGAGVTFFIGILLISLSLFIPASVLKRLDR